MFRWLCHVLFMSLSFTYILCYVAFARTLTRSGPAPCSRGDMAPPGSSKLLLTYSFSTIYVSPFVHPPRLKYSLQAYSSHPRYHLFPRYLKKPNISWLYERYPTTTSALAIFGSWLPVAPPHRWDMFIGAAGGRPPGAQLLLLRGYKGDAETLTTHLID